MRTDIEHDIYIKMKPKKRRKVKAKVVKVRKAELNPVPSMPCCNCKKGYEIYYANENKSCHDFCKEFKEWWNKGGEE